MLGLHCFEETGQLCLPLCWGLAELRANMLMRDASQLGSARGGGGCGASWQRTLNAGVTRGEGQLARRPALRRPLPSRADTTPR
ncbi:unnamed protein product [Lota lota]